MYFSRYDRFLYAFNWVLLAETDRIKMFVLDEADEMLSRGFKDQIYEVFKTMPDDVQVCFLILFFGYCDF